MISDVTTPSSYGLGKNKLICSEQKDASLHLKSEWGKKEVFCFTKAEENMYTLSAKERPIFNKVD